MSNFPKKCTQFNVIRVTSPGEWVSNLQKKALQKYTPVQFNVISITRGWVDVKIPGKMC